jgi:hypothetical protein
MAETCLSSKPELGSKGQKRIKTILGQFRNTHARARTDRGVAHFDLFHRQDCANCSSAKIPWPVQKVPMDASARSKWACSSMSDGLSPIC